jgi:hypothetical protein
VLRASVVLPGGFDRRQWCSHETQVRAGPGTFTRGFGMGSWMKGLGFDLVPGPFE